MIYICYIKYIMNAACVFAVGDNELGVGDDEDASSEAAEGHGRRRGRVVGGCRGMWHVREDWKITWLVLDLSCGMASVAASRPQFPGGARHLLGLRTPRNFISAFVIIIFVFYS